MLTCLRVRHFAIIDELEVELGPGLNVVTGETGAGKSILVDALELVLGARGRPDVIRTGEKEAEVEALFDLSGDAAVRARLEAAGMGSEDELLVRRVVQANGRTRAYVNGRLATAAQLAEIAAGLADISSQHEHHSLVDVAHHLEYLDAYAGLAPERARMERAFEALRAATAAADELDGRAKNRAEREDLLRFQIREIDDLAPVPGEMPELLAERERLRHAERLVKVAGGAEDALYARDEAVCAELARIAVEVEEAGRIDPRLAAIASQLDVARAQVEDAACDLGRYARGVTVDPERLAEIDERIERLKRLERKYGGSIDAILEHRERAAAELAELDHHEDRLAAIGAARAAALEEARAIAGRLSGARREAAERLGASIGAELRSLGMGDARVVVDVEVDADVGASPGAIVLDGARLGPRGVDKAELLIAPNRGEEPRPLRRIASGGELSRSMLAIKRVLGALGAAGLYVFDEVDAGVGGAVAEVIGQKLKDVARHHQVLCITHLPQIAVYADSHFRVHKEVVADRTRSGIVRLKKDERLEEIARMLGGLKVTSKTRAAAREMIEGARPG